MTKKETVACEVPEHIPRIHKPSDHLSETTARQLDLAAYEMEQGIVTVGEKENEGS